ncbi:MAG: ribonuclease III domain-containing protein [Phormidesmis sp.]
MPDSTEFDPVELDCTPLSAPTLDAVIHGEVLHDDKFDFAEPASQNFSHFIDQHLTEQLERCQLSKVQLSKLPPVSLAYIGDAVFELYVRSRLLFPAQRIRDYHNQVVNRVKAEQQADYVDELMPHLTDEEKDMLRRGRNATSGRHRRAAARSYQKATGFEALLGFLYLSDQSRLLSLLNQLSL